MSPCSHYWNYNCGTLSSCQVTATHLKSRYPWMKLMLLASSNEFQWLELTHWGWVTHICVCKLTIIGSDNGLSPDRRQAIFWTNAGILLIWPLGTNFSEMLIEIFTSLFKKMHLKLSSGKWRPFCLGLNVLKIRHHDSNPSIGCQVDVSYQLISPWTKWPPFWQTTFLNAFSWMKKFEFLLKFHWNLFLRV